MKDRTGRPNVIKLLPWWRQYLVDNGVEKTTRILKAGYTTILTRKDRVGLLQALALI
jgi:hypothetical protein